MNSVKSSQVDKVTWASPVEITTDPEIQQVDVDDPTDNVPSSNEMFHTYRM